MLNRLDAATVRRWCTTGLYRLRQHQHEIDELNVYPVPDGDTGTNMVLTLTAASDALTALDGSDGTDTAGELSVLGTTLRCLARGALLGARGNSGVILSQMFKGMADTLAAAPAADGRALADALAEAARSAYQAVAVPVEGTVLTVARAAAAAAAGCGDGDLAEVVRAAASAAQIALDRTPQQLPALARAGVVDAGGRGLVVLLDALTEVVTGEGESHRPPAALPQRRMPVEVARETGSDEYGYEVQYLLDAPAEAVIRLRERLGALGDSLVVVGAPAPGGAVATWNVHVHVNDVGAAIEAGVEAGRPHRIAVTRFADQYAGSYVELASGAAGPAGPPGAAGPAGPPGAAGTSGAAAWTVEPETAGAGGVEAGDVEAGEEAANRAVVVYCEGAGLTELFRAEGAEVVSPGEPGAAPSTAEILAAIRASAARRVVVLPNDRNVRAAADAAAEEARSAGIRAGVVPTRSPVQALAALAVRDSGRRFDDDVIAMAEAAGACRYAEVTMATREALTVAGRCRPGDVLALVDGEVNVIGQELVATCRQLLDRLLAAGGELVTLVTGDRAPADLVGQLTEHLAEHWPFVETQCFEGGQPHYPLLVGVE